MYNNKKIYDAHVHAHPYTNDLDETIQSALDYLSFTSVAGVNILLMRGMMDALGNDSVYLYLKTLYPEKFSVYNGLAIGFDTIPYDAEGLLQQVKDMRAAGFDGLKMINNRSTKDTWGFEFDDPRFDLLWDYLEETQYPITWHIGNTERWPHQRGPKSEILKDHPFIPGNEPNNEPLYTRLENVLAKHPNLHLAIPHWLFMAENRQRLEDFMERHPNVTLDACVDHVMNFLKEDGVEGLNILVIKNHLMGMGHDAAYLYSVTVLLSSRYFDYLSRLCEDTAGLQNNICIRRCLTRADYRSAILRLLFQHFVGHKLHFYRLTDKKRLYPLQHCRILCFDLICQYDLLHLHVLQHDLQRMNEGRLAESQGKINTLHVLRNGQAAVTDGNAIRMPHVGQDPGYFAVQNSLFFHFHASKVFVYMPL